MAVLGDVLARANVPALGVLDAQVDVPVLTGAQRQGDVMVVPRPDTTPATAPIPEVGMTVIAAEASTNTHSLHAWDGPCFYDPSDSEGLVLGVLTVPAGASAYLCHTEEHGANGIGPGTYELRRQREFAGEWRQVSD